MKKIALAYAMEAEIESLLAAAGTNIIDRGDGALLVYEIEPGIIAYAGGVGKVNAAMSAQFVIDRHRPDWIVNAGVAGSFLDLPIGTVVLAKGFVQHDMDTTAMGDPIGLVSTVNQVYFPTDQPERTEAILTALGVAHETGDVATGDAFMVRGDRADWVARTFSPTLCEMEGCAIAQVCLRNGVDFTALKSVSDRLCRENNAQEYFNFPQAMAKLNTVVLPFARALRDEKERSIMERIASFTVDHTKLLPGMYLSRRDGNVTTFDLRFKKPNTGDLLTNAEMHSVEHIIATLLRNSAARDAVIYFGPMGCQTGFYFLFDSTKLSDQEAIALVREVFTAGAADDGPMPGRGAAAGGDYVNLDVALARAQCAYYSEVIQAWTAEKLAY